MAMDTKVDVGMQTVTTTLILMVVLEELEVLLVEPEVLAVLAV
jgi:hypothetical protein